MKRTAFAIAMALLACSTLVAAQPKTQPPVTPPFTYNFANVKYPNATVDYLSGINDHGYTVGYHNFSPVRGFTLVPSTSCPPACSFRVENYPGSTQTWVSGINNNNALNSNFETAGYWTDKNYISHGFMHNATAWIDVDYPGTTNNSLYGLNDDNVAAGAYMDGAGNYHPYIYSLPGNQFTPLLLTGINSAWAAGINDSNQIVGTYYDSSGNLHGFELNGSTLTPLDYPGATETEAWGINNYGVVVGFFQTTTGLHGFIYDGGTWEQLDDPGAVWTFALGINDNFEVVGFALTSIPDYYGFEATLIN